MSSTTTLVMQKHQTAWKFPNELAVTISKCNQGWCQLGCACPPPPRASLMGEGA